jgi:hypothetical protein
MSKTTSFTKPEGVYSPSVVGGGGVFDLDSSHWTIRHLKKLVKILKTITTHLKYTRRLNMSQKVYSRTFSEQDE